MSKFNDDWWDRLALVVGRIVLFLALPYLIGLMLGAAAYLGFRLIELIF